MSDDLLSKAIENAAYWQNRAETAESRLEESLAGHREAVAQLYEVLERERNLQSRLDLALAWLGRWRDSLPQEAIAALQEIVVERGRTVDEWIAANGPFDPPLTPAEREMVRGHVEDGACLFLRNTFSSE